jgi:hypothetical protein
MRTMVRHGLFALVLLVAATACRRSGARKLGAELADAQLCRLSPGVTSRTQAHATLGRPDVAHAAPDGGKVDEYISQSREGSASTLLRFDRKGVLRRVERLGEALPPCLLAAARGGPTVD